MNNAHPTTVATTTAVPLAGDLAADWDLVPTSAVNVLLIGESVSTGAFVDAMRPHLVDPLVNINCQDGLVLSSVPSRGTVIFSDLDTLALSDQQRLNAWLAQAGDRPRVISTSRVSLVPMIDAGMFIESLYYRLNILGFDLASEVEPRGQRNRGALSDV